ncbi:MAG: MAPEG family protein [Alphaproteobacteria bacterium]|nr:MAPEG family protein [Alphaproteobacteria bacterium]
MSAELYWLTLVTLMTGLVWAPYIVNRLVEYGSAAVMKPRIPAPPKAAWAARMMKAHANAVENLAVFAPLALAVHVSGMGNETTAMAAMLYFWARLVHLVVQTLAVPLLRTLAFATGFFCQLTLALTLLGVI